MPVRKDQTGRVFGRLTVLYVTKYGLDARCMCLCECGKEVDVLTGNLRSGHTRSCGCLIPDTNVSHGMTKSAEYATWRNIVQRCTNPKNDKFDRYGGRGITVCDRWRTFENFLADMGKRPSPEHSVDRIDNDGPYSPENCRWATRKQQQNNRRDSQCATYQGRTLTMSEWAEETSIPKCVIVTRLKRGWSVERTLTTPGRH